MKKIQRIVVGTDFSDLAEHAFDAALDLAEQLGASVTLVHSYEVPIYAAPDGSYMTAGANAADAIVAASQAELKRVLERKQGRNVQMRSVLRLGPPWEEINGVAQEEDADLVVVATHGRRGLSRALLGSVSERVIRTATRPVLVVRGEDGTATPSG
jgi:nucleotide-binding universal stress UspA family protein